MVFFFARDSRNITLEHPHTGGSYGDQGRRSAARRDVDRDDRHRDAGLRDRPNNFAVADLAKGKRVVIFGLPGAFTPTCSAKHVPGYVANHDKLKAKNVDEVWCISVNDAFVMGAWGREQKAAARSA